MPDIDAKLQDTSSQDISADEFFSDALLETGDYAFNEEIKQDRVQDNIGELRENTARSRRKTAKKLARWPEEEA